MKIQQKNDFTLRLAVLAQGEREPITSATDVRVVFQNIDTPRERWEAARLVITDTIEVSVPAEALTLGKYAVFVYYTIANSARFAENGAAFTIVRSADEADAEGESVSADVNVAFAASGKNGLSAFELAQQAGYAGTFEQWLLAGENANNAALAAEDAGNRADVATVEALAAAERASIAADAAQKVAAEITAQVQKNTDAIATEVERAITAENELIRDVEVFAGEAAEANAGVAELRDSFQDLSEDVRGNATAITDETKRAQAAEAAAIEKGRQLALRDLYVAAGALYNDTDAPITRTAPWGEEVQHLAGHYYLNGLGDITEVQMTSIYNERHRMLNLDRQRAIQSLKKVRTLSVPVVNDNVARFYKLEQPSLLAQAATELEVITFVSASRFIISSSSFMPIVGTESGDASYMFGTCSALKHISALNVKLVTNWGTGSNGAFYNCQQLKEVSLYQLSASVEFAQSSLLTKRSVLYAIANAIPTSAITITLHPDAYARLAEDDEIVAALEAQPLITLVSA